MLLLVNNIDITSLLKMQLVDKDFAQAEGGSLALAEGASQEDAGRKISEGSFALNSSFLTTKNNIKDFVNKIPNIPQEGKKVLNRTLCHLADTINVRKEGEGLYLGLYQEGNGMLLAPSKY